MEDEGRRREGKEKRGEKEEEINEAKLRGKCGKEI